MKYILYIALAFVFACQPSKQEEIKQVKKEALEIHDEVMPKIGALKRTRKDLMSLADSLIGIDSAKAQTIMQAADDVSRADESMMSWMRNFDPEFEGTEEERLDYFKNQKTSIEEVKKVMNESLAKGREMLE